MNLTDGLVFLLLEVLCLIASWGIDRRIDRCQKTKPEIPDMGEKERMWELRANHIRSLSVPYEQGQEIVGRIGALCSYMTHEEMYEVFEHARRIVREREGFDREIH